MFKRKFVYQRPEDTGGGGAVVVDKPANPAPAAVPVAAPILPNLVPESTQNSKTVPDAPAAPALDQKDGKGYWPEDWRQTVSKADEKVLSRLQRYASPEAALQALIAAQNRISAGELKPVLGKNATPEQITEWRKEHGIPEAPDKYDLKDVKAENIPADMLALVLKEAHATNQTPDQVKATITGWNQIVNKVNEQRTESDLKVSSHSPALYCCSMGSNSGRALRMYSCTCWLTSYAVISAVF